jgi:methionine-gamma-lyase
MKGFRTRAVHAGQHPDADSGALITPVYRTSTFAYGSSERGRRLFAGEDDGFIYSRIGNPTVRAFETKLANLEGGEDAIAFASGMAALSALAFTVLSPGDEVIYFGPIYGGSEGLFVDVLTRFGVRVRDAAVAGLESTISKATRLIFVETPANPTLAVLDLKEIAALARASGALSVVDNTFATPYLTRPIEHGIDVVMHSATKYIGGHGEALGGALVGRAELMGSVRGEGLRHLGGCMAADEAAYFLRGLKTLPVRMDAHCAGAAAVAHALQVHPAVKRVRYPGLPEHPGHAAADRQMDGFGGMVSLDIEGGQAEAGRFLDGLDLFVQAVSLGDVDSLACHPASTTHQLIAPDVRARHGIGEGLVRLSVGLEDPEDLIEDLFRSLDNLARNDLALA